MQEQQLFGLPTLKDFELPPLTADPLDNAFDELELLGYPLGNPFLLLNQVPYSLTMSSQLPIHLGKTVTMLGYLVAAKDTKTSKGDRMHFGTFIDKEGSFIDAIHFPPIALNYPFRGKGFYRLTGEVVEEFDFYSLEVEQMEKEALMPAMTLARA